jgi:16S rRNA (guanine527-N7)-methyltransferase
VSAIEQAIGTLGLSVETETRERLDAYVALLTEANSQFNLTAIKDLDLIERNLIGGSLEVVTLLPGETKSLIDVGSGGGIPGMVIAIVRPQIHVSLLDATGKKVRFLETTAAVLGLENVTAVHGRAEDLAHDPAHREQYDVGTARAVARLASLIELVHPFVRPGGLSIFPKGSGAAEEAEEARQAVGFVGGQNTRTVPSRLDDTQYVLVDKRSPTPERFPRRVGIPGKRPIGVPVGQEAR